MNNEPPEIGPEKFPFEKYIGRVGWSMTDVVTDDFRRLKPGVTIIGWCAADRLRVRPRTEGKVILVEFEDGEQVWLHCFDELPVSPTQGRDFLL